MAEVRRAPKQRQRCLGINRLARQRSLPDSASTFEQKGFLISAFNPFCGDREAKAPTKAISVAKYLTNRALDTDRATALWDEAVGQELVTMTEDCKEGLAAFAERRPPVFRGW